MSFGDTSKKYWIVPSATLSPEDLVLGSVLAKPNDPIGILNRRAVEPIDVAHIFQEREQVKKSLGGALNSGFGAELGASSALAAIIGGSPALEGNWSRGVSDSIEATKIRAQHFSPTAEYVNKALQKPEIKDYVSQSYFSSPVYMVVGVAVASSIKREYTTSRDKQGKIGADIGLAGTGLEVSASLSANRGSENTYGDEVEGDVVLAYRARRFRYSRWKKTFVRKDEDETKPARYATGEEDANSEEDGGDEDDDNEIAVFSYFDTQDVSASDIGMAGFEEASESDE